MTITLIVIRLPKEILQQPTIRNYLAQLTDKPIRLLNISLAPGSQKENRSIITPLLRNCFHSYERNSTKASNHLFEET